MNASRIPLRDYVLDGLSNLSNPNYVPPAVEPYVPPAVDSPLMYKREAPKVYSMPPVGTPSVLSSDMRDTLDALFAGLDTPIDPEIVESAVSASEENHARYARGLELSRIANDNVAKVAELRDAHRYKDVMATPAAAIAKLNEIPVQGKFVVPDHMAHNMQALVSKRNQKEHGKRFKTSRVNGDKSFLQVWRTR